MSLPAKINLKNLDYFKFRKIVIDGNRDDYSSCSKEVKSLCDCVQTLGFRYEEFDSPTDPGRFEEIRNCYKQILQSKRIDPVDVRIKSGWWGEQKSGLSVGKIKSSLLLEVLLAKSKDFNSRQANLKLSEDAIEGPGIFVFKHRERKCFQLVERCANVFLRCSDILKSAFEATPISHPNSTVSLSNGASMSVPDGNASEAGSSGVLNAGSFVNGTVGNRVSGIGITALASLLVVSLMIDWDFYFISVVDATTNCNKILRIIENDTILQHDCLWPHGLNFWLNMESCLEINQFRMSCIRHKWPPENDSGHNMNKHLNLIELTKMIENEKNGLPVENNITSTLKIEKKPITPSATTPSKSRSNSRSTTNLIAASTPSTSSNKIDSSTNNRPEHKQETKTHYKVDFKTDEKNENKTSNKHENYAIRSNSITHNSTIISPRPTTATRIPSANTDIVASTNGTHANKINKSPSLRSPTKSAGSKPTSTPFQSIDRKETNGKTLKVSNLQNPNVKDSQNIPGHHNISSEPSRSNKNKNNPEQIVKTFLPSNTDDREGSDLSTVEAPLPPNNENRGDRDVSTVKAPLTPNNDNSTSQNNEIDVLDENVEPRIFKRSNTFTLSDSEETAEDGNNGNTKHNSERLATNDKSSPKISAKALAAAKRLSQQ